jgi:hypothetical protein
MLCERLPGDAGGANDQDDKFWYFAWWSSMTAFRDVARPYSRSHNRSSGTDSSPARQLSPAASSTPYQYVGKANIELTYCFFSDEHVDASSEELCSLVKVHVHQ